MAQDLSAELWIGPEEDRAEGNNHLPLPFGNSSFEAVQGTVDLPN